MKKTIATLISALLLFPATSPAQPMASPPLGQGPWLFDTYEEDSVRVSILARGLDHPFGMVVLPGTQTAENTLGDLIIAERYGKIRYYHNGILETDPIIDIFDYFPMEQVFDLKLHPDFENNGLIYFTYIREAPNPDGSDSYWVTTALGRMRWTGETLTDIEDVFVADAWSSNIGGASSRLHFLEDGTLVFGVSHRIDREAPQSLESHIGKVLRLNDDGTAPDDNPFVGVEGALPEIYTWGNRSVMDFTTHPVTGDVWELENGPQGGDEINILEPGENYGWPLATYGRDYDGTLFNDVPWVEGTKLPVIYFVPSITVGTMSFYTGDKFPAWSGSLFVTSMVEGRVFGTGHLQRIEVNEFGETQRERLLTSLHQRIRFVHPADDGFIYLLTDETDGALLKIEPGVQLSSSVENTDETLFAEHDCGTCHRMQENFVGPSWLNIASRYENTDANLDQLADRIIEGGGGAWGEVPMAPHTQLSVSTARNMASQILALD